MQQKAQAYEFNPDNMAPPEVKDRLLEVLRWHDDVMRDITKKIEMVPGLSNLLEEFSNALNECVYSFESVTSNNNLDCRYLHGHRAVHCGMPFQCNNTIP